MPSVIRNVVAALAVTGALSSCAGMPQCPAGDDYYSDCRIARRAYFTGQTAAVMGGLGAAAASPTQPANCQSVMIGGVMQTTCSGLAPAPATHCQSTAIGDVVNTQCQ